MTSASHAEGRGFDPHNEYFLFTVLRSSGECLLFLVILLKILSLPEPKYHDEVISELHCSCLGKGDKKRKNGCMTVFTKEQKESTHCGDRTHDLQRVKLTS